MGEDIWKRYIWEGVNIQNMQRIHTTQFHIQNKTNKQTKRSKIQTLIGVPAMEQWVKNLSAVAEVTVEVQVWSLALSSGLKDPTVPQPQLGCSSSLDSVLGLGTSICRKCSHKKKKKKKPKKCTNTQKDRLLNGAVLNGEDIVNPYRKKCSQHSDTKRCSHILLLETWVKKIIPSEKLKLIST